jgi:FKBP-type peptidyl-prolyl cis-trans isomerase (trigger factor)
MYSYKKNLLPKNTVELIIDIPKQEIKNVYQKAFLSLQKELTLPGFRKGSVPKEMAEKNIKKEKVYEKLIADLVPKIYEEIIKKESLTPLSLPKIELLKAKEEEDWQIKITLAQRPTVDLKNLKTIIQKIKAEQKKEEIWVPGKTQKEKENQEVKNQKLLNLILNALLKEVPCEISDLLIEEELNHRLVSLLDDIKKIGLTVDAYLKSKNLTIEQLKEQYRKEIEETYKLEFILLAIADKENITVEKQDLEKIFVNLSSEERKKVEENSYFYASILRKQKTLNFLINL